MLTQLRTARIRPLSATLLLTLVFAPAVANAQAAVDPDTALYRDLRRWETLRLVDPLPLLTPFPLQVIEEALTAVVEGGTERDAAIAERHLAAVDDQPRTQIGVRTRVRTGTVGTYQTTAPQLGINAFLSPTVSASGRLNINLVTREAGDVLAHGERRPTDWFEDWSDIDIGEQNISIRQELVSSLAVGRPDLYFQAGIHRVGYGYFDDGAVLSDESPFRGVFAFVWNAPTVEFNAVFSPLAATNHAGGGRLQPNKFMVFHSLTVRPFSWLEGSFFEAVIWGQRFEPLYFVPVASLYHLQGLGGFRDNALLGVRVVGRPGRAIVIPLVVFIDDIHFNDLVRFDFETKYKLSTQTGVIWNPQGPLGDILHEVSAEMLAVMPYMYTHWDENSAAYDPENPVTTDPNFSNYTHAGVSLGPAVDPNTLRITGATRVSPIDRLRVDAQVRYFAHGNASEDYPIGDGSLFDPGYVNRTPTFQTETRFLTQSVLEKTTQFSIGAAYDVPIPQAIGRLSLELRWWHDHTANVGFVEGTTESQNVFAIDASFLH
jgi:hypothetical protein